MPPSSGQPETARSAGKRKCPQPTVTVLGHTVKNKYGISMTGNGINLNPCSFSIDAKEQESDCGMTPSPPWTAV
jgi:hypothetical protein